MIKSDINTLKDHLNGSDCFSRQTLEKFLDDYPEYKNDKFDFQGYGFRILFSKEPISIGKINISEDCCFASSMRGVKSFYNEASLSSDYPYVILYKVYINKGIDLQKIIHYLAEEDLYDQYYELSENEVLALSIRDTVECLFEGHCKELEDFWARS